MTGTMQGKKALITGGGSGIGKQCAIDLANAGAQVTILGSNLEKLQKAQEEIGGATKILQGDLSALDSVGDLIDKAIELMDGLDVLICNAGITSDQLTIRAKLTEWQRVLDLNLTATFILNQKACLFFMRQKKIGRIVNISSVVASTGNVGQANYCASKGGMEAMTRALALEFASRNIGINCVAPGFIETSMTEKITDDARQMFVQKIPMKRPGTPQDISGPVLFLCDPSLSGYITGQVLHVNGGLYM